VASSLQTHPPTGGARHSAAGAPPPLSEIRDGEALYFDCTHVLAIFAVNISIVQR